MLSHARAAVGVLGLTVLGAAAALAKPLPRAPAAPPAAAAEVPARIGSLRPNTEVWEKPIRSKNRLAIGRLRVGTTVALRSRKAVPGEGCRGKWYAIEPHGYVCADETTTFDFGSPYWKALASVTPGSGPYPYRYAFSTGAPMYSRIPTPEEAAQAERGFGPKRTFKTLGAWSKGHEWLVAKQPSDEIAPSDPVPAFLVDHQRIPGHPWNKVAARVVPAGTGFSYAKAFSADGRTWLLTPELFVIPADRVFPYRRTTFHGVELGQGVDLPLAWVRGEKARRFRRTEAGGFEDTGQVWPNQAYVPLTGRAERSGTAKYRETREPGLWLAEMRDTTIVEAVAKVHPAIGPDEKWIEARILAGTMTAYRGRTPVWTTLWSGGTGGVPSPGHDPTKYSTTEVGLFRFQWKDEVATMSPDKGAPTSFWFGDVPNIQYVHAPMALHVAYWHDHYGFLMSAQCLNVSPIDGEWLFDFTDPPLPPGWGSVGPSPSNGKSTRIHIKP
jgi:hypothetical protein